MSSTNYQQQAETFLTGTKTSCTIEYLETAKHFADDKETRDIYKVTFKSPKGKMLVRFGNSINNKEHWTVKGVFETSGGNKTLNKMNAVMQIGLYTYYSKESALTDDRSYSGSSYGAGVRHYPRIAPTAYDILACLTKYHPNSFEEFCSEFGYDTDSKKAEAVYNNVLKEYADVCNTWTSEQIEQLAEIQ